MPMKIKKGDNVLVTTGKDKGKSGAVLRAFPVREQVLVEGINIVKKHQRGRRAGQGGQIVERAMPIHVSNVSIKDKEGKPTRVGYRIEDGKKVRIAKKSGAKLS
jgi:large subunit ribosomal protein L24